MKNILGEKPSEDIHGRLLFSTKYVSGENLVGRNVLDIGCGYGWFELFALKKKVGAIVGVEVSEKDLQTAKANVRGSRVKFKVGSALKLPFKDQVFDIIVCWDVLEHLPPKSEITMFSEAYRVLSPGGKMFLSTPNSTFCSNVFDPVWFLGHRHYLPQAIKSFAEGVGFKVVDVSIRGGWWELFNVSNRLISKWIFRRKPFFDDLVNEKRDREHENPTGFVSIFACFERAF